MEQEFVANRRQQRGVEQEIAGNSWEWILGNCSKSRAIAGSGAGSRRKSQAIAGSGTGNRSKLLEIAGNSGEWNRKSQQIAGFRRHRTLSDLQFKRGVFPPGYLVCYHIIVGRWGRSSSGPAEKSPSISSSTNF